MNKIKKICDLITEVLQDGNIEEKVLIINKLRKHIHMESPFAGQPVDYVEWVKVEDIYANDYNPNSVAPPEMKLLAISILEDGFTQPIVSQRTSEGREVVDGFHRSRNAKENQDIYNMIHGYAPVVSIRKDKQNRGSRMASTIRHNRARGTHSIKGMGSIIVEYINLGWDDEKICKHLGMEMEEVLRLKQSTGLKEAFANHEFSKSWAEFESKLQSR